MTETTKTTTRTPSPRSPAKPAGRGHNPVEKRVDVLPILPWDVVQWDAHDAASAKALFRFGGDAGDQERFLRWLVYATRWGTVPAVPAGVAALSHDATMFIMGGQHVMKQIYDMVNYRPPAQAAGNTEQG